ITCGPIGGLVELTRKLTTMPCTETSRLTSYLLAASARAFALCCATAGSASNNAPPNQAAAWFKPILGLICPFSPSLNYVSRAHHRRRGSNEKSNVSSTLDGRGSPLAYTHRNGRSKTSTSGDVLTLAL